MEQLKLDKIYYTLKEWQKKKKGHPMLNRKENKV
jgi:hypothetical protein